MKYILITFIILLVSGCGAIDRAVAKVTGDGSEVCQDNVIYLQFTSGTSVKYNTDGTIATCNLTKENK